MFLDAISNVGDSILTIRNDFIPDQQGSYDISTFGGNYYNQKYVFNLTRYLQSVVTKGQPYYTMRVYAPLFTDPYWQQPDGTSRALASYIYVNNPVAHGRVVLGGGTSLTQKMRVRIIYSKI